jgi:hypothetical protein
MTMHLSDLALDRIITGETTPGAHLQGCAECAARLAELERDTAAFRVRAPIGELANHTRRNLWPRRRALGYGATVSALAAAAGLVFMLRTPPSEFRAKGGVALDVFRKGPSGSVEALLPMGQAVPGDALRFRLATPQSGYAAIVSIDGAGAVTSYYPDATELPPIARGSKQLLDVTIELDRTLGKERLIALVCRQRLRTEAVRAAMRTELTHVGGDASRVEPARALPDCAATTFWFEKVPPR